MRRSECLVFSWGHGSRGEWVWGAPLGSSYLGACMLLLRTEPARSVSWRAWASFSLCIWPRLLVRLLCADLENDRQNTQNTQGQHTSKISKHHHRTCTFISKCYSAHQYHINNCMIKKMNIYLKGLDILISFVPWLHSCTGL